MSIEQLTSFFAWCTLLNLAFLILATILLKVMRGFIISTHANMFDVNEADLPLVYLKYLANYKVAIFVFNLAPYLALRMIY